MPAKKNKKNFFFSVITHERPHTLKFRRFPEFLILQKFKWLFVQLAHFEK